MLNWNESAWFALFASTAVKSTALLGLANLAVVLLRNGSAAARHLVWTTAAVATLALPFLSISLPGLPVRAPGTLATNISAVFETTATAEGDGITPRAPRQGTVFREPGRTPYRTDWRLGSILLWTGGAAVGLLQLLIAWARIWRARRAAALCPDRYLAADMARSLGLARPVEVLETAKGTMPMTMGILRPVIFMPRDAARWSEEQRHVVLLHELAHVKRGDVATHLIARLALMLNWWNPLAWMAWREFLKEGERAADDLVLQAGARASDYASHLLEVARTMQAAPALAAAAVAMTRGSQLEARLAAILDSRVNRKSAGRAALILAALFAVAIVAPLAALRAQNSATQSIPPDVDATIQAAISQNNYEMVEKPAAAFEDLQEYDTARRLLDAAVAIRRQLFREDSVEYGVGLMKLGDLETKRKHLEGAETFYSRALQTLGNRPEAAPALLFLGINKFIQKNFGAAGDYFEKAQQVDPSQTGAVTLWTALVREREQKPQEADALYRSALAVEYKNPSDAATAGELYARFLKEQGRDDEAKLTLEQATAVRKTLQAQFRPSQSSPDALRIGAGVTAPKVISKSEPEYTEEARAAKYQGTAVLYVEVGPDGLAHNIAVARGLGLGLDENARRAIGLWRFQPATKNGLPVTVKATIEVNFRLM